MHVQHILLCDIFDGNHLFFSPSSNLTISSVKLTCEDSQTDMLVWGLRYEKVLCPCLWSIKQAADICTHQTTFLPGLSRWKIHQTRPGMNGLSGQPDGGFWSPHSGGNVVVIFVLGSINPGIMALLIQSQLWPAVTRCPVMEVRPRLLW